MNIHSEYSRRRLVLNIQDTRANRYPSFHRRGPAQSARVFSEGCIESQFRAEHRAKTMESPIIVPEHALFQVGILGYLSGTWFRNTQVT